ncbi:TetR family transcriptional regulator [Streptomyces zinciresistens K42]|uniref:TetR family transcriptional regulator n=1 Tax=Streptomyces zinciresistens K42 TaxID=700597 RepID=G2GFC5_9ACTN|nr:TetR/AcrR family transcriptional regulator [Streptomyces zinciresistens]EGX57787.1 TetR family transcriptional regulator [Streptomyces zinciresistens K42]
MSADACAPAPGSPLSLRERRRAVAVREIVDAAERHLAGHGLHALSLRAVARDLGMTVQALYHYFPNRDALITVLVAKAYDDLADAVTAATDAAAHEPAEARFLTATAGYRRWAVTHRERFQLLYGAPLRHYAAPPEGPTTRAMRRISDAFAREMFDGFTTAQLTATDAGLLSPGLSAHLELLSAHDPQALPPPATALLLGAWGHMHGMVVLETFGHTAFLGEHQAELFDSAMRRLLEDVHRRIPARPGGGTDEP